MDKRWKNLGLFFVGLVVLIILYFLWINLFQQTESSLKTIDEGYEELDLLFTSNDVNIENLQLLRVVELLPEGNIIWQEDKEKLVKLKLDLIDFNNKVNSFEESAELSAITSLYIGMISYCFSLESSFIKISDILHTGKFDCSRVGDLDLISLELGERYLEVEKLKNEGINFSLNYDVFSSPVAVDIDEEYNDYTLVNSVIIEMKDYCEGVKE